MNTKTVDYVKESENFYLSLSDDEKVEYYTDLVLEGIASKQDIEYTLRHKKKLLSMFKKNTKGIK